MFQSDNLLSYLTVEETLTYTAQLALQKHSAEAIRKKVMPPHEPFLCGQSEYLDYNPQEHCRLLPPDL